MRLSDLTGKEVINLADGSKLGTMDECELIFDLKTGKIESIVVPNRGFFNFLNYHNVNIIRWEALRRIGEEVVIVDLSDNLTTHFDFEYLRDPHD